LKRSKEELESGELIVVPSRALPATGVPISGIHKYAELPSRKTTERDLLNFVNACLKANNVNGCVIKAWWGEGKTDAFENFIMPLLDEKGQQKFEVVATTVARVLERRQKEGSSDAVAWIAFLGALFESIWQEGKTRPKGVGVFERLEEEAKSDFKYVQRVISKLAINERKLFIFLDELEQLEIRAARDDILAGIRGLFDLSTREQFLKGNLHIIMACTPDAFNRLIGSSTQMGGLLERLIPIELPRPLEDEAARFVYGLVDYVYEGKTPRKHPFLNSGVAYAVMYAGHRSPRSTIKALQQIMEFTMHQAAEKGHDGYLLNINGYTVLDALKDYKLPIFGTEVYALDGEILRRIDDMLTIEGEMERTEKLANLVRLMIGEPIPHSIEEISSRIDLTEGRIRELIGIANNRANETDLLNGLLILPLGEASASINKASDDLQTHLKTFVFRQDTGGFVSRSFFATSDRGLKSIHPEMDLETAKKHLKGLLRHRASGEFYLVAPELVERIYPNPNFLELDFIVDRNKRLELWKEANEKLVERQLLSQSEETLLDLLNSLKIVVEQS
jgi:hypothetical protein